MTVDNVRRPGHDLGSLPFTSRFEALSLTMTVSVSVCSTSVPDLPHHLFLARLDEGACLHGGGKASAREYFHGP